MRLLVRARSWEPWRRAIDALSDRPRLAFGLLAAVPVAWIAVANLAPLAQMGAISLMVRYPLPPGAEAEWTLANYAAFVERPHFLDAYLRSFVFATMITILTLAVVFPVAWYVSKAAPRAMRLRLLLLLSAPFWMSEIVRSVAWILVLSNRGALNTALVGLGVIERPVPLLYTPISMTAGTLYLTSLYMLLPLYAAFEKIADSQLQAAADLGAGPLTRLRRIVLPLARDGIVVGCTLVFLLTVGLFALPQLLGGPDDTLFAATIGAIFERADDAWPLGAAQSVILIAGALAWVGAFALVVPRPRMPAR